MVRSGKNGDLHLKQIAYYKRTGEYHPTTLPSERSGIRRAAKKFVFKEKKLFYVGKDRKQNRLVIVSEEEKKKVLRECHENDTGAHHGISRTLTLVESSYYWTSVTNDVKQWINVELCRLFGTKQIVISHASQAVNQTEGIPNTIKTFLSKHCADHPNNWDDHLSAVSFAFNITHLEPTKNTPYFQMFNRNPYMPETSDVLHEVDGDNTSMFAKILGAIKEADKIMETKTTSVGQVENNTVDETHKNKIIVKKKPKQLNPFHLKVGHEVLRQRKNWWKDGRFQSEWVGPCVIDYITESGCAVLRDNTGTRLKRPIKMSHLKPYVRESSEQDSLYLLQGSVVADHDYIGLPEIPVGAYQASILVEDATIGVVDNELLTSSKDGELLEYRNAKISPLIEDNSNLEKQTFSLLDSSNQVLEYLS
ncbi:PREDICTED: gypsy retrotransposon integrase-like protein 1 isoform X3 [Miniopterus natalensis]|uniref:gypsy retrotransposon integrase-like protein 1 isoform X3 n=1 Tax=Miniopterus natalensis TaxID=291302 RepID=UPI0007A7260C|nr:PREDICTED: gypsy retrotransposon integrase-like protein 1 isoform X3 [Miniopterus natalensis]